MNCHRDFELEEIVWCHGFVGHFLLLRNWNQTGYRFLFVGVVVAAAVVVVVVVAVVVCCCCCCC